MKKIVTIAAVAALATLAACSQTETAPANEAVATDAATANATDASAEKTGGPCGDGTVLRENEQCR